MTHATTNIAILFEPAQLTEQPQSYCGPGVVQVTRMTVDNEDTPASGIWNQMVALIDINKLQQLAEARKSSNPANAPAGAAAEVARAPDSGALSSSASVPGLTLPQNYSGARTVLTRAGFNPLKIPRTSSGDGCLDKEICSKFPEVVDCSGTGLNPCRVVFVRNDGRYLMGVTNGEEPAYMTLVSLAPATASDTGEIRQLLSR